MTDNADRALVAARAAEAGAAVAHRSFRADLDVETKGGKTDLVTRADRDAQSRVFERIREQYPDDPVVGEERDAPKEVPDDGAAWVVDPIDGTSNYVRGVRLWCTAVAAVADGDPVASAIVLPAVGDTYTADRDEAYLDGTALSVSDETDPERCTVAPTFWWQFEKRDEFADATREAVRRFGDLRRYGSAQATLAFLASGAVDGAFTNLRAHPWDTVAGVHMVRRAGGRVTDIRGDRWRHDARGVVASNGRVHGEVLAAARGAAGID